MTILPPSASGLPVEVGADVPTWIHILPLGTFTGLDGRGPFHAGDAQRIIAASMAGNVWRALPIDYDHQIDLLPTKGGTAPAAGWITDIEARPDGLWAKVDWTTRAARMIREREYRAISPVFMHGADNQVLRIARAALTNNPALELTSLNSRNATTGASTMPENQGFQAKLRKALGLAEDADENAIIAAVEELTTQRASFDPAKHVPIEVFERTAAELRASHQGATREAAERAVKDACESGLLFPFMREWALELCMSNRPAFDRFVNNLGAPVAHLAMKLNGPAMHPPAHERGGVGPVDEVYARVGLSAEDVKNYGKGI